MPRVTTYVDMTSLAKGTSSSLFMHREGQIEEGLQFALAEAIGDIAAGMLFLTERLGAGEAGAILGELRTSFLPLHQESIAASATEMLAQHYKAA